MGGEYKTKVFSTLRFTFVSRKTIDMILKIDTIHLTPLLIPPFLIYLYRWT